MDKFWLTPSDVLNSLVALLYTCLMISFPIWSTMKITKYFGKLDDKDVAARYGMLYEDIDINYFHTAHYNNYFMLRRFAIGMVLIMFYEYTLF